MKLISIGRIMNPKLILKWRKIASLKYLLYLFLFDPQKIKNNTDYSFLYTDYCQ